MNKLLKFFAYAHLPEPMKSISQQCADLAQTMDINLDESAEKTVGLRKLLEAKDCFVRAVLPEK